MRIDVHQHLLSQPLLAALERRGAVPSLTRGGDGWTYHLAGEPDSALPFADADLAVRAGQLEDDGVDRALVLLSSALGIEHLPAEEAAPLLDAYHDGAAALPSERFGAWGAVGVHQPDPSAVDALLARGFVGVSLPATALATPAAVERLGPLLARLEQAGAPLFVHPGPVALDGSDARAAGAPAWWPALTDYVAQMNAAWHAFLHTGRPALPRLRVLFAMLAGLAPLQLERLAARGGPAERAADDPLTFYDTSSYGPQAIHAVLRAIGPDQLVHGSDRPVVGAAVPAADTAVGHALLRINPARLLSPTTTEPRVPAAGGPA
ncbi:amidohydrolase family protein [Conexibacter stalactiti]|uniref:Amidohydrolase family protein n=1 Tax=Conexibacter stalactiti TaxID=1940611 RepID=A0ABU4HTB5_9ACTN|nr:amidohydrolase family protein [Conexibacter stalactiti]MDW5596560.1 amidohydrolase family protein [Conexibacter stalactiti]MEC5037202.1 amidohydrolase family protein [Conexibacter stalactiti]